MENDEESEEEGTGSDCKSADSVSRATVPCPVMGCADLVCRSCANPRNIIHDGEMMTIKDGKIYYGRDHTGAPNGELEEESTDEQIASLDRWHKQQDEAEPSEWHTEIDSAEMRDAVSVAITEGENEEQVRAWEEEDAAVKEGKDNFEANGGFDRSARTTDGAVPNGKEAKRAMNVQKVEQMAEEARAKQRTVASEGLEDKGDVELNPYHNGPSTSTVDAIDLSSEAFPDISRPTGSVLGESLLLKNKESEKTGTVNKAVNMNKFMRAAYGVTPSE